MSAHEYGSSDINWLVGPEVEGQAGAWRSTWVLRLSSERMEVTDSVSARERASRLRRALDGATISLRGSGEDVVVEMTSVFHPLEPECFPLVDDMLMGLDAALGGISEINGSPCDQWRTFRSRSAP
jgi:hypothetical protein